MTTAANVSIVRDALAKLRPERYANLDVPAGEDPEAWSTAVAGEGWIVLGVEPGAPSAATLRLKRKPS